MTDKPPNERSAAALRQRLKGQDPSAVADALDAQGFSGASQHLRQLLNESVDVINSHPNVLMQAGMFRPTPGDGGA